MKFGCFVRSTCAVARAIQSDAGSPARGPQNEKKGNGPSSRSSDGARSAGSPWIPKTLLPSQPYQGLGVTLKSTGAPWLNHQNIFALVNACPRSRARRRAAAYTVSPWISRLRLHPEAHLALVAQVPAVADDRRGRTA